MAESAYTKGPLIARPDPRENGEWEVVKSDGDDGFWYVAALFPAADGGTAEGNAKLYVAAPDLLAFVREVAERDPVFAQGSEKRHIKDARALVARALGHEG